MKFRLICGLFLATVTAAAQTPIKLQLPCEYRSQQLSTTGKHVAVRCKDKSVHLFEIPSGKELAWFPAKYRYDNFDFSSDGGWFGAASLDGEVELISLSAPANRKHWKVGSTGFDVLKFVSKDTIALAPHAAPGAVWNISSTPKRVADLDTDFDGITAAAASPDGQWLVTTGADTVVRFYRAPDWKKTGEYRELMLEPFAATFTADGKYAVVGGADRQITLFDPAKGSLVKALPVEPDPVVQIDVMDRDHVAVTYLDADDLKPRHLSVWDLASGTATPVTMDSSVIGGGIVDGHIWLAHANGNTLELSAGK